MRRGISHPLLVFLIYLRSIYFSMISNINGLSLGADDYISKPFGVMELRARINAHLRREHREHSVRMVLGRVCIQMSQKKLLMDDKELPFTKAEYEICEFLAKNRGQVFSKEQILEAVFGFDNESNDSTIITHIKNIRAKFADYDYMPIKTVWAKGEYDQKLADETVGIPADTTNTEWPAMVECAKPVIEQSTNRFTWACGVESNVDMTPVIKENFIKLMAGSITADEFVSTMQDAAK